MVPTAAETCSTHWQSPEGQQAKTASMLQKEWAHTGVLEQDSTVLGVIFTD